MSDTLDTVSDDRQQAIARIIALMNAHRITTAELSHAMGMQKEEPHTSRKVEHMTRLFSILGGIFIFSGIGTYIAMFWAGMNTPMRIIVTLGIGLTLHFLALMALRGGRYIRSVKPLLLIAALLQTTGWFVVMYELFPRGNEPRHAVLFVMAVMALQQGVTFARHRLTLLLFHTLFFAYAFLLTLLDLLDADRTWVLIVLGVSMMALAQAVRATPHYSLSSMGYFIGGAAFFSGIFDLLHDTPVELLYVAAACGLIYVSTVVRSSALLTVSTIALLGYIGYFTSKHFVNSVGWPISLVLLGIVFFMVSGFAMRVKKKYIH